MVALSLFEKQKYGDAEAEVLSFLDMGSPHHIWLGKSYLIWGDVFFAKGDYFQAKYTFKSIIENYPIKDDGITEQAAARLQMVIAAEDKRDSQKLPAMEIEMNESRDRELFGQ
jgi:hypothetical protein